MSAIERIRTVIDSSTLTTRDKNKCYKMLGEIEVELEKLSKTNTRQAKKIVKLTEERLDSHLTYDALTQFESENLTLVRAVNVLCNTMSNLGV